MIFTSPFLTIGGHPNTLIANPARDFVSAIPATWDETVVFAPSEPGKVAALARRRGAEWFVAAINGGEARTIDLPLGFLKGHTCTATTLRDADRPDAYDRGETPVRADQSLKAAMAPAGGFVARMKNRRKR